MSPKWEENSIRACASQSLESELALGKAGTSVYMIQFTHIELGRLFILSARER
jgi:hypothetical protein